MELSSNISPAPEIIRIYLLIRRQFCGLVLRGWPYLRRWAVILFIGCKFQHGHTNLNFDFYFYGNHHTTAGDEDDDDDDDGDDDDDDDDDDYEKWK